VAGRRAVARTALIVTVVVLAALFVAIQFVPLAGAGTNPAVVAEPAWDRPITRRLAARACFDCHSNETRWPWYSRVAPASWLVARDTIQGRESLNFSEWGVAREQADGEDAAEEVREGDMPMPIYLALHPEARLDDAERDVLAQGLRRTLGASEAYEDD
jgi:mono/diheme cytochrome c family protein